MQLTIQQYTNNTNEVKVREIKDTPKNRQGVFLCAIVACTLSLLSASGMFICTVTRYYKEEPFTYGVLMVLGLIFNLDIIWSVRQFIKNNS